MRQPACSLRPLAWLAELAWAILAAGCATTAPPPSDLTQAPTSHEQFQMSMADAGTSTNLVSIVRRGRYTLVELLPESAQRDLMQQVVEVTIPPMLDASVGDAMRHVLKHSGYQLCEAPETVTLHALPLPAAHLRLGPLALRDALLTLAGPAWEMVVDDTSRQVCFKHQMAFVATSPTVPPTDSHESTGRSDSQEGQP